MPFCRSCGVRVEEDGRFCGGCGASLAIFSQDFPKATIPQYVTETPQPVRAESAQAVYFPQGVDANVGLSLGRGVCPKCFATQYVTKYTLWHALVCIFVFPLGLLCLLAPVNVCRCGHRYGLGTLIVLVCKIILVFVFVGIISLAMLLANYQNTPH